MTIRQIAWVLIGITVPVVVLAVSRRYWQKFIARYVREVLGRRTLVMIFHDSLILVIALGVGAYVGASYWKKMWLKQEIGWYVPENVLIYQAMESNDLRRAKIICGNRIWGWVRVYDEQFSNEVDRVQFQKHLPDARRIIAATRSNEWYFYKLELKAMSAGYDTNR